eukprot:TRINITY_DN2024_c0_g1_i7.p1 TRINITY_DN2024_c0_g1~~TRINITY_DN2024_c0_g1_i7.p1  ORF type:complete len:243 (+),score=-9.26 TRINITY_DN2024_c0_g1_i7:657-1385(+)
MCGAQSTFHAQVKHLEIHMYTYKLLNLHHNLYFTEYIIFIVIRQFSKHQNKQFIFNLNEKQSQNVRLSMVCFPLSQESSIHRTPGSYKLYKNWLQNTQIFLDCFFDGKHTEFQANIINNLNFSKRNLKQMHNTIEQILLQCQLCPLENLQRSGLCKNGTIQANKKVISATNQTLKYILQNYLIEKEFDYSNKVKTQETSQQIILINCDYSFLALQNLQQSNFIASFFRGEGARFYLKKSTYL